MMSPSHHRAITSIPNLQRCFLFSTNKLSRLAQLVHVHSSWGDTIHNYSHGILESWLYPTEATIADLADLELAREDDFKKKTASLNTQRSNTTVTTSNKAPATATEESSNTTPRPASVRYASEISVDSRIPRTLGFMENEDETRSGRMKELREMLQARARRVLSGALVRACQLGFRWLVSNICESPSRNALMEFCNNNHDKNDDEHDDDKSERRSIHEVDLLPTCLVDPATCHHYSGVPIFAATSSQCIDIVRYLISRRPDIANQTLDLNERTPLFIAADRQDIEMMRLLIDEGKVDPRHVDYSSDDVLQYCAFNGRLKSLEFLIYDAEAKKSRIFTQNDSKEYRKERLEQAVVNACSLDRFQVVAYLASRSFGGPEHGFPQDGQSWMLTMTEAAVDCAAKNGSTKGLVAILENVRKTGVLMVKSGNKDLGAAGSNARSNARIYESALKIAKWNLKDEVALAEIEVLLNQAKAEFCR